MQRAFGDALQALTAAHLPYNVPLAAVQYVTLNGTHIPLPGGPPDPLGEFNSIEQFGPPGSVPLLGSSYIQAVTWKNSSAPRVGPPARVQLHPGRHLENR